MNQQTMERNVHIPIVTDLVISGDPTLKKVNIASEGLEGDKQAYDLRLKQKMAELRETIGQEEGDNIARAHAIRAEAGNSQVKISDTHHEMNLDRDRAEVMKKLSHNDPDWN
jgi:hypothetical protein